MKLPKYPFEHKGLVLQEGNFAVLSNGNGALCGYVAIPAAEVPREWHGDYSADGLQYLHVHGGITYCGVGGGDEEARIAAEHLAKDTVKIPHEEGSLDDKLAAYARRREAIQMAAASVPYSHVVFGFDCGHAGDDTRAELGDPQHVLQLAKVMNQQLLAYAARIEEWRAANREGRTAILDEIRETASIKGELGFGAMIALLGGARELG